MNKNATIAKVQQIIEADENETK